MLKDINRRRPDRQLERNLLFLAYAIMFMSLSLFALFIYPDYSFYIIISIVIWNVLCILITIRILQVSETAIGFGALSAEILNDKSKYCRVDNAEGEAILINRAAEEYFRNTPILTFLEQNIIDLPANKMDLQKLISAVNKLQSATVELSINPHQNSVFVAEEWLRVSVKPIYLNKADIFESEFSLKKIRRETYIFWTVENISAYKNMDAVFKGEMTSLHSFLDYLPVGLYTCDDKGCIEYINNILAEKLNTDKNDAIGKKIDDFIAYKPELLHTPNGEYDDNITFKSVHGHLDAYVKQRNIREKNELKTRGVVICDLPNDEELRNRLNLVVSKFEQMFNTAPIGILLLDEHGLIIEINKYVERLLGRSGKDLAGQKVSAYLNDEAQKQLAKIISAEIVDTDNNVLEAILNAGDAEKNVRLTIFAADSGDYGEPQTGYVLYLQDTTNRRSLEMQVAQAQKMESFGQLVGMVAHDFNNLLTAVVGYCDLLLRRHGIGDPSFVDLIELKNNVTKASGVARQLLTISRRQPLNPKVIEATEAFTENDHLISRILGEKIKLVENYGQDLGYIRVDTVQLSQVLLNLAINARDAMNGEGTLTLSAHVESLNKPYHYGADIIKPGDFVVISVSDTGCGIPPENLERIFEPFFSTKKNILNSGTGLGLAMVDSIVRQTGGFMKVYSEVGKGTTFEIYLPSYDNSENVKEIHEQPKEEVILDKSGNAALKTILPHYADNTSQKVILGLNIAEFDSQRSVALNPGEIRILFVDDEDAVRMVGARGLRQKGYEVVDCISAENAMEHIDAGEKFDLVITDMRMPGMSGAELATILHERYPQMRIILASGYSEEIARKELAGSQDFYFIAKPYGLDDLNKKVKAVLAK
ncbi:MAG: response regulator [Alphaproteobacteria bacterium]|nr:response regulator [Alphaproteobacteria bacterium]